MAPAVVRSRRPIVLPEGPSTLEIVRPCMRQLEERQSVFPDHQLEALALGQGTVAYAQYTQQSPGLGLRTAPQ